MPDKPANIKQMMNNLVKKNLDVLFQKTFNEISVLPECDSEEHVLFGRKVTLSIWHDVLFSQEHRIIVQVYKHGILGIGMMQADGFAINSQNEKRSLTQEEWAPFS